MPHLNEKLDLVAETFIVNNGKVLLRVHDKYKKWLSVGGHIEPNEDPADAAVREVKEEIGLDVELVGPRALLPPGADGRDCVAPLFVNRHRINPTHEHVALIYAGRATSDVVQEGDDEKSGGIRWFGTEELDDPAYGIAPHTRFYARAAIRMVAGVGQT
ncbi:MAG: NUDIX domain-containing protein [Candidatus Kerfeldbacteria bacterium]|nr:NUDIX domain-containing protein [Candidatus Kerfeldbacteria bacterium]